MRPKYLHYAKERLRTACPEAGRAASSAFVCGRSTGDTSGLIRCQSRQSRLASSFYELNILPASVHLISFPSKETAALLLFQQHVKPTAPRETSTGCCCS